MVCKGWTPGSYTQNQGSFNHSKSTSQQFMYFGLKIENIGPETFRGIEKIKVSYVLCRETLCSLFDTFCSRGGCASRRLDQVNAIRLPGLLQQPTWSWSLQQNHRHPSQEIRLLTNGKLLELHL